MLLLYPFSGPLSPLSEVMAILSIILWLLIVLGCCYALFSLACVFRFFKDADAGKENPLAKTPVLPAVSVLKPVKGLDPNARENLSSFCVQDYPCFEVLFGFRDPDDPAIPVAAAVAAAAPCDARVVVGGDGSGANQKMLNLQSPGRRRALSDARLERQRHGGR